MASRQVHRDDGCTSEERQLFNNFCLLGVVGPGSKSERASVDITRFSFRKPSSKVLEHVLYCLYCAVVGDGVAHKELRNVYPVSDASQAKEFNQRISDWLRTLKDGGHLEMNSISTASQLRSAFGFRLVSTLLDLSCHALYTQFQRLAPSAADQGYTYGLPPARESSKQVSLAADLAPAARVVAARDVQRQAQRYRQLAAEAASAQRREDSAAAAFAESFYSLRAQLEALSDSLDPDSRQLLGSCCAPLAELLNPAGAVDAQAADAAGAPPPLLSLQPPQDAALLAPLARARGGGGGGAPNSHEQVVEGLRALSTHLSSYGELASLLQAVSGMTHPHAIDGGALAAAAADAARQSDQASASGASAGTGQGPSARPAQANDPWGQSGSGGRGGVDVAALLEGWAGELEDCVPHLQVLAGRPVSQSASQQAHALGGSAQTWQQQQLSGAIHPLVAPPRESTSHAALLSTQLSLHTSTLLRLHGLLRQLEGQLSAADSDAAAASAQLPPSAWGGPAPTTADRHLAETAETAAAAAAAPTTNPGEGWGGGGWTAGGGAGWTPSDPSTAAALHPGGGEGGWATAGGGAHRAPFGGEGAVATAAAGGAPWGEGAAAAAGGMGAGGAAGRGAPVGTPWGGEGGAAAAAAGAAGGSGASWGGEGAAVGGTGGAAGAGGAGLAVPSSAAAQLAQLQMTEPDGLTLTGPHAGHQATAGDPGSVSGGGQTAGASAHGWQAPGHQAMMGAGAGGPQLQSGALASVGGRQQQPQQQQPQTQQETQQQQTQQQQQQQQPQRRTALEIAAAARALGLSLRLSSDERGGGEAAAASGQGGAAAAAGAGAGSAGEAGGAAAYMYASQTPPRQQGPPAPGGGFGGFGEEGSGGGMDVDTPTVGVGADRGEHAWRQQHQVGAAGGGATAGMGAAGREQEGDAMDASTPCDVDFSADASAVLAALGCSPRTRARLGVGNGVASPGSSRMALQQRLPGDWPPPGAAAAGAAGQLPSNEQQARRLTFGAAAAAAGALGSAPW